MKIFIDTKKTDIRNMLKVKKRVNKKSNFQKCKGFPISPKQRPKFYAS